MYAAGFSTAYGSYKFLNAPISLFISYESQVWWGICRYIGLIKYYICCGRLWWCMWWRSICSVY